MRFGMYFEIILNKKWLFSCRNTTIIIVARICWGAQEHMLALLRNFGKCDAVWCVLKYIFIRLCIEIFPKKQHIFI